jgi:hypothetical protein
MNKVFVFCLLIFFSCSGKKSNPIDIQKAPAFYYPYSPRFDIDFEMGDNKHVNIILNFWRGYSSGDIKAYRKYFSDSLTLVFSDKTVNGKTEDVLKIYQERRNTLSTIQAHIDFWQAVFNKEKNESWVLLWITQEGTNHQKQQRSNSIHQVWKFDGGGKVYEMQEFTSGFRW